MPIVWIKNRKLLSRLEGADALLGLFAPTCRLVDLTHESAPDVGLLADAVEDDPDTARRVLELANSALFGHSRRAANLRQVYARFGSAESLHAALSVSMVRFLRGQQGNALDTDRLICRSIVAAIAARILAEQLELPTPGEIFLATLLQDVGMLAIDQQSPEAYEHADPWRDGHLAVAQAERDWCGAEHPRVGAWLLSKWGLPVRLQFLIAHSHAPTEVAVESVHRAACSVMVVGSMLADLWLGQRHQSALQDWVTRGRVLLHLERPRLLSMVDRVGLTLPKVSRALNMPVQTEIDAQVTLGTLREMLDLRDLQASSSGAVDDALPTVGTGNHEDAPSLPGVLSRADVSRSLLQEFERSVKHAWPISVSVVEVAEFDETVETYGGWIRVPLITHAAQRLKGLLRPSDLIGRIGHATFLTVMPGTDTEGALHVSLRLREGFDLQPLLVLTGTRVQLRAVVGTATQGDGIDYRVVSDLVKSAVRSARRADRNSLRGAAERQPG
jgi:diguanylate cyclase (GGDEF)-like protein